MMDKEREIIELARNINNFCKTLYDNRYDSFCRNGCHRQTECGDRRKLIGQILESGYVKLPPNSAILEGISNLANIGDSQSE